jgi:NAD(P)H dehydrogenase (quinone)
MQDMNVLVVFHSRTGVTEKLALAAAVGAVQAKANIRLRWLREAVDDRTVAAVPGWKENRERMEREYIAPREVDAEWADAIVIGANGTEPELKEYLGSLAGKAEPVFLAVSEGSSPDALEKARVQGRRATEAARAVKTGGATP